MTHRRSAANGRVSVTFAPHLGTSGGRCSDLRTSHLRLLPATRWGNMARRMGGNRKWEAARFCWGAVLPMPSGSRDNLGHHKLPPQGGQSPHFLLGAEPCTEHAIRGSSAPARRLPSAPRGPPEQTATFSWKGRWMLWSVCLLTTSERLYVRTQFLLCCE